MKILSFEFQTDLGRRVVQLSPPVSVETSGEMPPHFRSLTERLWSEMCKFAAHGEDLVPKVQA